MADYDPLKDPLLSGLTPSWQTAYDVAMATGVSTRSAGVKLTAHAKAGRCRLGPFVDSPRGRVATYATPEPLSTEDEVAILERWAASNGYGRAARWIREKRKTD